MLVFIYNNNKRYKVECHGYLAFYCFVNAINNRFNDSFRKMLTSKHKS